jgi:hypothetical protein
MVWNVFFQISESVSPLIADEARRAASPGTGISSAVRHAETLAALRPGTAFAGSFAPPPAKPNAGLSAAMQALLKRGGSG